MVDTVLRVASNVRVLGPAVIPQSELAFVVGILNQMRTLGRVYDEHCADLLSRMLNGAAVEPGVHIVELEESFDGPIHTTRLVLH